MWVVIVYIVTAMKQDYVLDTGDGGGIPLSGNLYYIYTKNRASEIL